MAIHTLFDRTLQQIVVDAAEGVRPAERLTVSEAAAKYRVLKNDKSYVGPWLNDTTPYLREPMDLLTSASHVGMIFVGPAQTGKTDMVLNWLTHSVICDPTDMMIIEKKQASARDFSMRRVDRLHRDSVQVGQRLIQRRNSDNTFDKRYRSGMILSLSWPSIDELSGRPIPRLWLTDYDRMDQDVDGEGTPYDLAAKRATSFARHGMCVAESSPGFMLENPKWVARSRHEAPPTEGILKLYNRGDRRRWYWQCVGCLNTFEPSFSLLQWPKSEDLMESAELGTMVCPHCNMHYSHDPVGEVPGKHELNRTGRWVKDGQIWRPDGRIVGTPFRSDIGSFWMKGPAATFTTWRDLIFKYLTAEKEYEDTGVETALKTTVNTDQGEAYTPKAISESRLPETLKARAKDFGIRMVPPGVRFLVAAMDVQKNRWEVQVHGLGVGGDVWIIDRFKLQKSRRVDDDGERHWVNPGAYFEDWKLILEEVMMKTYPLLDGSGREMAIKMTVCDSGGREGVTTNAYKFVRWLRYGRDMQLGPDEKHDPEQGEYVWQDGFYPRFYLVKGEAKPDAPRYRIGYPDSQRKDRHAGARGEVPVVFMNTNALKDTVDKMLDRTEANGGRISFPNWLPDTFYTELTVEIKDPAKGWINPRDWRNESWDLLVYCYAATLTPTIHLEHIDWTNPPSWAAEWATNDLVFNPAAQKKPFEQSAKSTYDFAKLANDLA